MSFHSLKSDFPAFYAKFFQSSWNMMSFIYKFTYQTNIYHYHGRQYKNICVLKYPAIICKKHNRTFSNFNRVFSDKIRYNHHLETFMGSKSLPTYFYKIRNQLHDVVTSVIKKFIKNNRHKINN